jgi:aryl-alcohol dehydrogenase-like predicted oxidoreductase
LVPTESRWARIVGQSISSTKLSRLEENIGAVAVELTPDDLREIDSAASKLTVQGARYLEELERRTGL